MIAALWLAACATSPPPPAPVASSPPQPLTQGVAPRPPGPGMIALADLPGWASEDHAAALAAFERGCGVARGVELAGVCRRARERGFLDEAQARLFLETHFQARALPGPGLLTAYFAPEYEASAYRHGPFTAPVRPRPADLVTVDLGAFDPNLAGRKISARLAAGDLTPYPDRAAIEAEPVDEALAWMRPEDLFFMQIQGSGVLRLADGRRLKASYNGSNGRPFVGVAAVLRDRGDLAADNTSGEAIRAWLAAHRGPEADEVMRKDPRYVFFKVAADDGIDPVGAAGAPLTPGRALAMDPSRHAMGELFWIDASAPSLNGAFPTYRRLAVALDVGAAIKGEVRADLYLGRGEAAGLEAGRVRHALNLYALQPVPTDADSP